MKKMILILIGVVILPSFAMTQTFNTEGEYSPAVMAKNFNASYGVRPEVVLAILDVYQRNGLSAKERVEKTESLIRAYRTTASEKKGMVALAPDDQNRLGIQSEQGLVDALNWDLFAKKYYLSTKGANSPAIVAHGNVSIWYGIPESAMRTLAHRLEANQVELGDFSYRLNEMTKKYEELKKEFENYGVGDPVVQQAEHLLEEGKLEEAEHLIDSDFRHSKKRVAYKGYLYGKTEELLLKYESAALGYKDATYLDPENVAYSAAYAAMLRTMAHYDDAIGIIDAIFETPAVRDNLTKGDESALYNELGLTWSHKGDYNRAILNFEKAMVIASEMPDAPPSKVAPYLNNIGQAWQYKGEYDKAIKNYLDALGIDSVAFGTSHTNVARDWNNIGVALKMKGEYDKAISYYYRALAIDTVAYGSNHPAVAIAWNNIGVAHNGKGEYDKAIMYYERALSIDSIVYGIGHPQIASYLSSLGVAWARKGYNDKAIRYFERALEIDTLVFGVVHTEVAMRLNNLGAAWSSKGEFDKGMQYHVHAFQIDTLIFGNTHPDVARDLTNIGSVWSSKNEYDKAILCFEQALAINTATFGSAHESVGQLLNNIGGALMKKGEYDKALTNFDNAQKIQIAALGKVHPLVATTFSNFGVTWRLKGDHSKAITYFEQALEIDTVVFGFVNRSVARDLSNLGKTWEMENELLKAIEYFEQTLSILLRLYPATHGKLKKAREDLGRAVNVQGMKLLQEGKPIEALHCFERALQYSEMSGNVGSSLVCLRNIGSVQQQLGSYGESLQTLNRGIKLADSLRVKFLESEILLPDSILATPKYATERDSLLQLPMLRSLRYQMVGCLAGLDRKKEAKTLAKELMRDARKAKDEALLECLKDERW